MSELAQPKIYKCDINHQGASINISCWNPDMLIQTKELKSSEGLSNAQNGKQQDPKDLDPAEKDSVEVEVGIEREGAAQESAAQKSAAPDQADPAPAATKSKHLGLGLEAPKSQPTTFETEALAASVVILHDLGEDISFYEHGIKKLLAGNLRVYAFDFKGHGENKGLKFDSSFRNFTVEVIQILAFIKHLEGGVAPFVLSQGLGSLVGLINARKHPNFTRGLIACSPMFQLNEKIRPLRRFVIRSIAEFIPNLVLPPKITPKFTRNRKISVEGDLQKIESKVTAVEAHEFLKAMSQARKNFAKLNVPTLLICPDNNAVHKYSFLKNAVSKHKQSKKIELINLHTKYHALASDRAAVLETYSQFILPWIEKIIAKDTLGPVEPLQGEHPSGIDQSSKNKKPAAHEKKANERSSENNRLDALVAPSSKQLASQLKVQTHEKPAKKELPHQDKIETEPAGHFESATKTDSQPSMQLTGISSETHYPKTTTKDHTQMKHLTLGAQSEAQSESVLEKRSKTEPMSVHTTVSASTHSNQDTTEHVASNDEKEPSDAEKLNLDTSGPLPPFIG